MIAVLFLAVGCGDDGKDEIDCNALETQLEAELETLFTRSFNLKLIRLFPYMMASLTSPLSDMEKDAVAQFTPTRFME